MSVPVRLSVLALSLALLVPAAARTPPPAGWSVVRNKDMCALDSGPLAVVKSGVRGAQDIFGRGYANTNNGLVVVIPGWQSLSGDDEVLVRLPGQARYRAAIRQIASNPNEYFIIWGEGQWFRQLGHYDRIELEAPPQRWTGKRVTMTYDRAKMAQALAWLKDCGI
ncbi:MAG TPA: hypothetical protein PKD99_05275 [Sphingopyxis sp.]|nr:hypothetical protein [Sphingopyxis sp.]HMP44498.1 hypothetical protein [Sphingopyxis sp.]